MNDSYSNQLSGPLNSIVDLMQTELDELLQQKVRIKLRMRNLRRRLGILQADSREADARNKKKTSRARSRPRTNATHRAQARKIRHLHQELARACRIAFLELGGSASPDELYAAILRRGSFSFPAIPNKPIVAISHVLTSMAQSGEAICRNEDTQSRWTYQPEARPYQ